MVYCSMEKSNLFGFFSYYDLSQCFCFSFNCFSSCLLQRLTLLVVFIATFLLSLTWQFNQFILLIQAMALFTLDCLDMIPEGKVS